MLRLMFRFFFKYLQEDFSMWSYLTPEKLFSNVKMKHKKKKIKIKEFFVFYYR